MIINHIFTIYSPYINQKTLDISELISDMLSPPDFTRAFHHASPTQAKDENRKRKEEAPEEVRSFSQLEFDVLFGWFG